MQHHGRDQDNPARADIVDFLVNQETAGTAADIKHLKAVMAVVAGHHKAGIPKKKAGILTIPNFMRTPSVLQGRIL